MEDVSWFVRPLEEARATPEEVAAANATRSSTPIVAMPGEPRTATGGGSSGSPVEQVPTLEPSAREPVPTSVTEQHMNFVAPASSVMVYRQLPNKLMSALPLEANTSNFELGLGGFGKVKFGCMQDGALAAIKMFREQGEAFQEMLQLTVVGPHSNIVAVLDAGFLSNGMPAAVRVR